MAFRYEIQTYGDPKYYGNSVVFATFADADQAGRFKRATWTMAENYRVVETSDTPNYSWRPNVGLVALPLEG